MSRTACLVFVATFLLAGCGGASAPASSAPAAPASKPAASVSTAPSSASSKPAASTAAKPATSGEPIKIGLIEDATGVLANTAKDNIDAFNLYLAGINNTVAGRKIEVIVADSQLKADLALNKAKQLVEVDKVNLLSGLIVTNECYAVAPYVKEAQVPTVVANGCVAQDLLVSDKYKSPWLVRTSDSNTQVTDPAVDWAIKQGFKRASMISIDNAGGVEASDVFASGFISRGGTIVQEQHPAFGTPDMGPYVSQIDPSADLLFAFETGIDGLRLGQALASYSGPKRPVVLDSINGITDASNLPQLKEKAEGIVSSNVYSRAYDGKANQDLLKAWSAKYGDRLVGPAVAHAYAAAQVIVAAIQKVNGNVEDKQAFMNALYATNTETVKGPLSLDQDHDVVEDVYIAKEVKKGDTVDEQLIDTYKNVPAGWVRTPEQLRTFPFGQMKGKWVGMTKDQIPAGPIAVPKQAEAAVQDASKELFG
ncbi:MAG TPA: ABC transporter substrate-binding protein [Chloroflexota bacterium]|nr:ABC transporter substrate-binding protein [Chloroflexota bacterium]